MKKTIYFLSATTFVAGIILNGCSSSAEKAGNAQTNVSEANKNLAKVNEEYLADIENYKKATADKIAANEQNITEFNARIEREKKDAKIEYKKKIATLEQKNSDMKKKMDDYKAEGKENWEKFKVEFNHDMDELGTAFKDLTVKNVK